MLRRGGVGVGVPGLAEADMDLGVVGGGLGVGAVAVLLNILLSNLEGVNCLTQWEDRGPVSRVWN